jgi:hypothetical protein
MSRICLHCQENETTCCSKICDACHERAGCFLENNVAAIKAIPYLIEACQLALTEIDQWKEVMGSDDPRTDAAIEALEDALKRAA